MRALDMEFAETGYLREAGGQHLRHIQFLDDIMRLAVSLDVTITWADLPPTRAGQCFYRRRVIVLARWLYWCLPWFVRKVALHELAHFIVGPSEERVLAWQQSHVPHLTQPPDWGVW